MIWYPYASSKEFPELGQGGRSAMAGAFYTFDKKSTSENKFPEYYDDALFVFDWMRNWVIALRFDEDENYVRSEPFMTANGDFRRPIDMTFGKDGVMYMLEYGSVYGADNDDARLVKIVYNTGNRAPIAKARVTDSIASAELSKKVFITSENRTLPVIKEIAGEAPLKVRFSSNGSADPDDDDNVTYQWSFDGKEAASTKQNAAYTYTQPGIYHAVLKVTDQAGLSGTDTILVKVGNQLPEVHITSSNNRSFFWDKKPFKYNVTVSDKEDGKVDAKNVSVYFDYTAEPGTSGNQPLGSGLIANSDCKACHTLDKVSVGPSYVSVSQKYKGQADAVSKLSKKIIEGGGGVWGESVMSAHPQLSVQDVNEMVKYILALAEPKREKVAIALQGTLALNAHKENEPRGMYTIKAAYTDKGGNVVGPLTGNDIVTLRNAIVKTVFADAHVGFRRFGNNLTQGNHKAYILLKNIDLTGIKKFIYTYSSSNKDGAIEVRIDSYAGPVIAKTPYKSTGDWNKMESLTGTVTTNTTGKHDVYFIATKPEKPNDDIVKLTTIEFKE
jgi:cytochrome c